MSWLNNMVRKSQQQAPGTQPAVSWFIKHYIYSKQIQGSYVQEARTYWCTQLLLISYELCLKRRSRQSSNQHGIKQTYYNSNTRSHCSSFVVSDPITSHTTQVHTGRVWPSGRNTRADRKTGRIFIPKHIAMARPTRPLAHPGERSKPKACSS
jgi:hypothetical protein